MYLLNTQAPKLQKFGIGEIPPYAILSHTWQGEEITFEDIQNGTAAQKSACNYSKVAGACLHAQKYGFDWIWIDSCCIDKTSSAELSEAINSMYQYYEESQVCYVYLHDASAAENPRDVASGFRRSRWFKRGWTLQELIAPSHVVFLDHRWSEIGTRWSLRDAISIITSIPVKLFEDGDLDQYSIAQRMSWAAFRETGRPEDVAYCLMGIFGVNMPPIYGEGSLKAFMRLQQEIIKLSDDRSIFAWKIMDRDGARGPRGLLAMSPLEYRLCGEVGISESPVDLGHGSSFSFINNGLHIHLPLQTVSGKPDCFLASLHCPTKDKTLSVGVYIKKTNKGQYIRYDEDELPLLPLAQPHPVSLTQIVVREEQRFWRGKPSKAQKYIEISDDITLLCRPSPSAQFHLNLDPIDTGSRITFNSSTMKIQVPRVWRESWKNSGNDAAHWQDQTIIERTRGHVYQDRAQVSCGNGGLITFALQKNANVSSRLLEIDYDLPWNNNKTSSMKTLLKPPELHFSLPPSVLGMSVRQVYPPDYCTREEGNNGMYFSCDWQNTHRVITYDSPNNLWGILHLVVGIFGSSPWIDAIFYSKNSSEFRESPETIWNSYCDQCTTPLWRGQRRLSLQTSSSITTFPALKYGLDMQKVTIEFQISNNLGLRYVEVKIVWGIDIQVGTRDQIVRDVVPWLPPNLESSGIQGRIVWLLNSMHLPYQKTLRDVIESDYCTPDFEASTSQCRTLCLGSFGVVDKLFD